MRLTTPRIPPLPESSWSDEVRELLPKGLRPLNIFTTLVRHPALFKRWSLFGGYILSKSTLPARERELVILRTGHLCKSPYEFHQHTRIALDAGVTAEEITRLQQPDGAWNERDAALVRATDELLSDHMITDATWQKLRESWDEKQLLDLLFTIGQYTLVSMVLNTLGVQIEAPAEEQAR
ncbi:MAG: carboxymuconolactone decarboxylase family protein [Polyangiales bacterium]